jgi:tetratricopeptide (TPR) repeat protein
VCALLATSLRTGVRKDALEAVLGPLGDTQLRVALGTDFKKYALLPKEARLAEVARAGPSKVAELADACELGPEIGRRLVYLWVATKALVPYTEAMAAARRPVREVLAPGTPSRVASAEAAARASEPPSGREAIGGDALGGEPYPSGLSAEALALFTEVKTRLRQIDEQNYFEMLAVPRDASAEAIRAQFLTLAKRWHPDRLPPDLAVLRPEAERLFHFLNAAHDTLTDDAKRAAYLKTVIDGGGTPASDRQLAAVLNAAMEQQRADLLMKRRDFAAARPLLEHALTLSEEDPDLRVSYAWCLLNLQPEGAPPREVLPELDRALSGAPNHDRAHFYRGLALRRLGREAEAVAAFRRAAEANPKNLDAARELRIAAMRGQLAPEPAKAKSPKTSATKDEGLLSKLFGSSKKSG